MDLKRLVVWLLEALVATFLLGVFLDALMLPDFIHLLPAVWVPGLIVGALLFTDGFYITLAVFGLIWRSPKWWLYPTIAAALFVVHMGIVFVRLWPDVTPEARALALPFEPGGACIVFSCTCLGNWLLRKWTKDDTHSPDSLNKWVRASRRTNPYTSATIITVLAFAMTNIAHFLRPASYDDSFRTYGLPFHFYREGGFVKEWVWKPAAFIWQGAVGDAVLVAAIAVLFGMAWQKFNAARGQ